MPNPCIPIRKSRMASSRAEERAEYRPFQPEGLRPAMACLPGSRPPGGPTCRITPHRNTARSRASSAHCPCRDRSPPPDRSGKPRRACSPGRAPHSRPAAGPSRPRSQTICRQLRGRSRSFVQCIENAHRYGGEHRLRMPKCLDQVQYRLRIWKTHRLRRWSYPSGGSGLPSNCTAPAVPLRIVPIRVSANPSNVSGTTARAGAVNSNS